MSDRRELLLATERELMRRLRDDGYVEVVTSSAANGTITLRFDNFASTFDDLELYAALARHPVIRDQSPPPARPQASPRVARPVNRRLSWLIRVRGR